MVEADTYDDAAIASVCQLRGLQTLWLAFKNYLIGGPTITCGQLALGSMASLTELSIEGISPAAIKLPSRCKLHILAQPKDLARNWWAGAAQAGQLALLDLTLEKPDPGRAMPNFLAALGCTTLSWVTQHVGSFEDDEPCVFAAPAFAALSALYLDATTLCIFIHASMRLRALHIVAGNLTVGFGNSEALATSLEDLSLVYMWGNCGVVEVALALQRVGKGVEKVVAPMEEGYEGICTRQDLVYCGADPWPCTCGACLGCLGKKQVTP
ncbi:g3857 [Coccomyxa elongata]